MRKKIIITFFVLLLGLSIFFLTGNLGKKYQPIAPSEQVSSSEIKPMKAYGKKHPLVGVEDVILNNRLTIVLTNEFPAIHIFSKNKYWSWGREGNGPMEFQNPSSIEVSGDTLFVLDFQPGNCKIVAFTLQGEYLYSQLVRGAQFCLKFKVSGQEKLVGVGEFASPEVKVVVVKNGENKTLLKLSYQDSKVELITSQGPMNSFDFSNPFVAQPVWTANNSGEVIVWNGESNLLKMVNVKKGTTKPFITVKDLKIRIKPDDVNRWIEESFSSNQPVFGYKNFYKDVREEAKENISVPEYYSLLTDILIGNSGYIWLKRTYYREGGQIWTVRKENGKIFEIQIPQNRSLIAVGKSYIAALHSTEKGIELVELYAKEDFF